MKNVGSLVVGACLCLATLVDAPCPVDAEWWLKLLAVGVVVYYGYKIVSAPHTLEKVQRRVFDRGVSSTAHYAFYDEAFRVSGVQSASMFPYFQITDVRRHSHYLYLYYGPDNAYLVDQFGFSVGEWERLCEVHLPKDREKAVRRETTWNQKPIGLIGAMKIEVDAILAALENTRQETHGGMAFTAGRPLRGGRCVAGPVLPGKVNAALCAQAMIDHYSPRLVLNLGVAGGIGENVHIGDVVIATACVEYDFDTSALDQWPAGQLTLPGYEEPLRFLPCGETLAHILSRAAEGLYGRAHLGIVATGDKFVADPRFGEYLQKEFGALACEMEGGAIAHACLVNKIPCAVLRTISDNAHDSETVDFVTFAKSSAEKAQQLLRAVLPQL